MNQFTVQGEPMPIKSKLPPFAVALRSVLDSQDISVAELSRRTGIHRVSLQLIRNGKQIPTWPTVEAIAGALGVSTDVFRK
jgi:transcriptional regulator with XRE-family HTH domain